jgi:hypothetical protein
MRRLEWRLVAGGEIGTAALLRAVRRRTAGSQDPAPDERFGPESTLLGYSAFALGMALSAPKPTLRSVPCDAPSKLFLKRIAQFRFTAPSAEWNGVWSLVEK